MWLTRRPSRPCSACTIRGCWPSCRAARIRHGPTTWWPRPSPPRGATSDGYPPSRCPGSTGWPATAWPTRNGRPAGRPGSPSGSAAAASRPTPDHAVSVVTDAGLREALGRLSRTDREALLLIGWEGLDHDAAARVLGCSAVAFKVRLHRARKRLARLLEAADRDGPVTAAPPPFEMRRAMRRGGGRHDRRAGRHGPAGRRESGARGCPLSSRALFLERAVLARPRPASAPPRRDRPTWRSRGRSGGLPRPSPPGSWW